MSPARLKERGVFKFIFLELCVVFPELCSSFSLLYAFSRPATQRTSRLVPCPCPQTPDCFVHWDAPSYILSSIIQMKATTEDQLHNEYRGYSLIPDFPIIPGISRDYQMANGEHKNAINKNQRNMATLHLEYRYPTTVKPGYSSTMKHKKITLNPLLS